MDRAEARKQFMAGVDTLNQPYKPSPVVMSKRDFEDILKYEEGLRMKDKEPPLTAPLSSQLSARQQRRKLAAATPKQPVPYTKRNRKSKK